MAAIVYSNILHKVYSIFSNGNQYKVSDLLPLIQEACGFTDEQMKEMTKGGNEQKVKKLVQWAVTHLYDAGLTDKVSRGTYVISTVDKSHLSLGDKEFEKEVKRLIEKRKALQQAEDVLPRLSSNSWALEFLSMEKPDLATIRKGIRSLLVDAGGKISIEELQELLKEAAAENNIQYELVVEMKNKGNKREPSIQVCFAIKDSRGNEYPFDLGTRQKAEYLTFLYMNEGVLIRDFCTLKETANQTFRKIYDSLYNRKGAIKSLVWDSIEDKGDSDKMEAPQKILVNDISVIRSKIAEAAPSDSIARQFVIASDDNGLYTIQGTNEDIRDKIRKTFSLKQPY